MRIHTPSAASCDSVGAKPLTAARDGFSLNAAVACQARQRAKLERLCRYMSRPPIALQRLSLDGDGLVVYELKHPFRDGTTHVLLLRASCPAPYGPAFGGSKSLPAISSSPWT